MYNTAQVVNSAGMGLMDCIEALGGSQQAVLAGAGIDPRAFAEPENTMPVAQFSRLLQEASRATARADIGFRFARNYDIRWLGPLGYLLYHADSLGQAMEDYSLYFHTLQSHTKIEFEISGSQAAVGYKVRDSIDYDRHLDAEFSTAIIIYLAEAICGPRWALTDVHFEHSPTPHCNYKEALRAKTVEFCSTSNRFSFSSDLIDVRNRNADRQLASIVRNFLISKSAKQKETEQTLALLSGAVEHLLKDGIDARIETVADSLGMSVRRIQRECNMMGTTFSSIRSRAVINFAAELLSGSSKNLTEIALILGFSESSAFSRAFRTSIGVTPKEFRKSVVF